MSALRPSLYLKIKAGFKSAPHLYPAYHASKLIYGDDLENYLAEGWEFVSVFLNNCPMNMSY